MQKRPFLSLIIIVLVLAAGLPTVVLGQPVQAQAGDASSLIAEVNAYRSANGLAAYDVDGGLMSLAQGQSEYQASIGTCTHNRADGTTPADYGISAENVACGMNLSVSGAVYGQWADALHSATMLGPETGLVGAGVATSGSSVYYTLAVKRGSGSFTYREPVQTNQQGTPLATSSGTNIYEAITISPLMTSTPNDDGSIVHIVKLGETLIQIAESYQIRLADIYSANPDLDPLRPVYYEGQKIIIRLPYTATPDYSPTPTQVPSTATPRPTRTATLVPTHRPTRTITPTSTETPYKLQVSAPVRKGFSIGVIVLCALGLGVVVFLGFLNKKP